ncbi:PilZ domain-containing protein [Idiomarina seosinensis]|uniref:PilZ domain-containing protein n=1 Tax=Idiomarina seosinensis TaxID=281739 RepID=A0A432ZCX8_9GAMM|nr:PilZ domain-containing protein [Idiomarina seosinensis]RUO75222.1 hypothetical protein CWI81_09580 [Idiomarina seosinensis]
MAKLITIIIMSDHAHKLIDSGYNQIVELQKSGSDAQGAGQTSLHLTLIGQHYPDYLILELPCYYRWQDVLPELRASDKLIMRTISQQGEVIAGYVNLVHATQFPDKLLFVSYPQQMQSKPLRKTPRMAIDVSGQLMLGDEDGPMINGYLKDISANGFGFDCEGILPCIEAELIAQQPVLNIQFSDDEHESFAVKIRAVEKRGPKQWRIGLESDLTDEDRIELMHRLLLNSLPVIRLKQVQRSERSNSDNALQD